MNISRFQEVSKRILGTTVLFLMSMVFMGQGGCGTTPTREGKVTYEFYPAPPDEPRFQFLAAFKDATDIGEVKKKSLFAEHILGTESADELISIVKPYGVAIHDGKIYACDTQLSAVIVFDIVNKRASFIGMGSAGKLRKPVSIYVDDDGKKYVADTAWSRVLIYDEDDEYYGVLGEPEKMRPVDVVVIDDDVLILDFMDGEIEIWDKNTQEYKGVLGESIDEKIELASPTSLAKDNQNNLYIVESMNFRVMVYDEEGHLLRSFGEVGDSFGQFSRPKGIAVDRAGRVYVVDAQFANIQVFDNEGALLTFIGGSEGKLILPADVAIDYDNVDLFRKYVHPDYNLKFIVLVTSQFGPRKIVVYGFIDKKK